MNAMTDENADVSARIAERIIRILHDPMMVMTKEELCDMPPCAWLAVTSGWTSFSFRTER